MPYAKKEKNGKDAYDKGDNKMGVVKARRNRKKVCPFCVDKATTIDYKDITKLRKFVSERGKILPRRISGCCAAHQRHLTLAVKQARFVALMPFSAD